MRVAYDDDPTQQDDAPEQQPQQPQWQSGSVGVSGAGPHAGSWQQPAAAVGEGAQATLRDIWDFGEGEADGPWPEAGQPFNKQQHQQHQHQQHQQLQASQARRVSVFASRRAQLPLAASQPHEQSADAWGEEDEDDWDDCMLGQVGWT